MKLIDLSEISEHKVAINADNITEVIDNSDYFIGNYDYAQKVLDLILQNVWVCNGSEETPIFIRGKKMINRYKENVDDSQYLLKEVKEFWGITKENHHERIPFINSLSSDERKAYYLDLHKKDALTILKTTHGNYKLSITFKELIEHFKEL